MERTGLTRREAMGSLFYPAAAGALASLIASRRSVAAVEAAENLVVPDAEPDDVARNEKFWFGVQQAFAVDRGIANLNNGGVSPAPVIVHEAMKRHLDHANSCPAHVLWQIQEPQALAVAERLARAFGAGPDEIAITRNASESLQICQMGIDLKAGDEVLTTEHDYPRMINTFKQRQEREGIVLRQIRVPLPLNKPGEMVGMLEEAITPRTRLILVCHMINITGQILPVREIVAMARRKAVAVIVDGAHALAHFDFKLSDLECDYYGVSLHKWLFAPHGTGLLYVRREKIADLWPLMAADSELRSSIRKFEQIGTHPVSAFLAIAEALTFHQGIGGGNKQARLVYLRDHWLNRLRQHDRVIVHTNTAPGAACGIATIQLKGVDSKGLVQWLWDTRRILTAAIVHERFEGVRISPSVYTTLEELDRMCEAIEHVIENGLPAE